MTVDPGALEAFKEAQAAYQDALETAATRRHARDTALLALRDEGVTLRVLATATGLSLGRVQQIINRAESDASR